LQSQHEEVSGRLVTGAQANGQEKKADQESQKESSAAQTEKAGEKSEARSETGAQKTSKRKIAKKRPRGKANSAELVGYQRKGLGSFTGGQSGDIQGISGRAGTDSESVTELLEEGQTFEAEAVAGVENAADPDVSEVVTHQFPEDDVPEEYQDPDKN